MSARLPLSNIASVQNVRLACHAMATRFELVLHGSDAARLRAAGEEAVREIERLEARLSLYQPSSEVSRINAQAPMKAVTVNPEVFELIQRAIQLSELTNGAFDITVAPLMRCWGFMGGSGQLPAADALQEARECVGHDKLELDVARRSIRFTRPGVMIDLGSIGKGYALEQAAGLLRDNGIDRALLHGGTSTVVALGAPPDADAWRVAIPHPDEARPDADTRLNQADPVPHGRMLAAISLCDESLSVSAGWGKSFEADGGNYGHVIDPRTGAPVQGTVMAAVVLKSATESDALSTALLVAGLPGQESLQRSRPAMRSLLVSQGNLEAGEVDVRAVGIPLTRNERE